ncbi:hypothetical protein L3X38_028360 [Prunus dulcis]|uniref:Uncharacterized protein n=1 Tax=Prunus dulcis TaxID=3755 RepID=A0AAD4VQZ6_PRUDU|nr:hypothetical protein L3X38_028360 [Prunus dulcis]
MWELEPKTPLPIKGQLTQHPGGGENQVPSSSLTSGNRNGVRLLNMEIILLVGRLEIFRSNIALGFKAEPCLYKSI